MLAVAVAAITAGLMAAGSAWALVDLPQGPISAEWPFAACDVGKHQFIIDASATDMCAGDGRLFGPGWAWRPWPGLVNGGQHYMSFYDAPAPPDDTTKSEFYPTIAVAGYYQVWASWRTTHNRAKKAPYYVYADDGETYRMVVDQSSASDGFRAVLLGTFLFDRHAKDKSLVTLPNNEGDHSKGSDAIFVKLVRAAAPTGLKASDGTLLQAIELRWRAVTGAAAYHIYRSPTGLWTDAVVVERVPAPAVTWRDTPLREGRRFVYWFRAEDASGKLGPLSNRDPGSTGVRPAVPAGVRAIFNPKTLNVRVSWQAAQNATSYRVYRSPAADPAAKTKVAEGVTDLFFVEPPPPAGDYLYFVRAETRAARSDYSLGDAVTVP
jgi:hypothetical protein